MINLKWSNLKINRCPQCNGDLARAKFSSSSLLLMCKCGFKITTVKMEAIVSEMVEKGIDTYHEESESIKNVDSKI